MESPLLKGHWILKIDGGLRAAEADEDVEGGEDG